MLGRRFIDFASAVAFALLLPQAVWAQATSGITGVVRDDTGGVLPGVQVEARSPALIEQVRTAYTDGQGLYRIVDLVPGSYTVTFILPGFRTVVRSGVVLPAAFTATVSAELAVGGISESVTVSGAAPVVDIRNVAQNLTVPSEIRDAIPLPTSSAAYVVLIPAARQNPVDRDVGGMRGEQAQVFGIHGTSAGQLRQMRDGMDASSLFGGGNRLLSLNPSIVSEVIVQTQGDAKVEGSGALVDVVLRDGGNRFSGSSTASWGSKNTQSDNIDAALRARGASNPGDIKSLYDYSFGVGGPIVRDKLWFYTAGRRWLTEAYLPGIFFNATQGTPFYTPDLNRPSFEDNFYYEFSNRLTWQAAEKHKITFNYSRNDGCQCHVGQRTGTLAPEAAGSNYFKPDYKILGKWSFPVTTRLLIDAGTSLNGFDVRRAESFDENGNGERPGDYYIQDLSSNFGYGSHARSFANTPSVGGTLHNKNYNFQGNVSYVTGSHSFSTGVQGRHATQNYEFSINNSRTLQFNRAGPGAPLLPTGVIDYASPIRNDVTQRVIAAYAQDQWTVNRLTLNLGLRFDYLKSSSPEIITPAGLLVPERVIPAAPDQVALKDVSPRVGVAYDVFGDGRTALKAGLGRYVPQFRFNDQQQFSPARQTSESATRTWDDANGDFIPQESELGPRSDANFGQARRTTEFSRDVTHGWGHRPYNYQGSVQLDHQLDANGNLWVSVGYFRTWFGNFIAIDNRAVTAADFDEFTYTTPVDPRLPGGGGQVLTGLFNQSAASFGRGADRVAVLASSLGDQTQVFNGVDITMRGRFPNLALITGGVSFGKMVLDYCGLIAGNPQLLIQVPNDDGRDGDAFVQPANRPAALRANDCRVDPPWSADTSFKLSGIMPLPYDFQVSATWQNLPSVPTNADIVLGATAARAQLGRNLTGGGQDRTLRLYPDRTRFEEPRANQIDFRVSRRFRIGTTRIEPQFNVFNLTNANDLLDMVSRYGAAWQNVSNILPARLIKLGIQFDF